VWGLFAFKPAICKSRGGEGGLAASGNFMGGGGEQAIGILIQYKSAKGRLYYSWVGWFMSSCWTDALHSGLAHIGESVLVKNLQPSGQKKVMSNHSNVYHSAIF
jgi:hypothetical protein